MDNNFRKNSTGLDPVEFTYSGQVYNGEQKKITIAYMLCDKIGNSYKIKNFQEVKSETATGMDGSTPYFVEIKQMFLPTSQCNIVGDVANMPGFKYIEIPYWLYKKNIEILMPKRWDGSVKRGQFFVPPPNRSAEYYKSLGVAENQTGLRLLGIPTEFYSHYLETK